MSTTFFITSYIQNRRAARRERTRVRVYYFSTVCLAIFAVRIFSRRHRRRPPGDSRRGIVRL